MYAVIQTGGKQYRVKAGDLLVVDKLDGEPGAKVAFDKVLMIGGEAGVVIGAPMVDGAVVDATLIESRKGEKIKVFKKIRRQGYRRTQGHRQHETVLRVTGVAGDGKSETWDGEVDLTPKSALDARARGLKIAAAEFAAPQAAVAEAPKGKTKAAKAAPVEAEAPVVAETPVVEAAAPVAEAAPAKTPAAKKAAPKKTKTDGDDA